MYWEWGVWGAGDSTVYIFVLFIIFFSDIAEKIYFCKKKRHQNQNTEKKLCKEKIPNIPGV